MTFNVNYFFQWKNLAQSQTLEGIRPYSFRLNCKYQNTFWSSGYTATRITSFETLHLLCRPRGLLPNWQRSNLAAMMRSHVNPNSTHEGLKSRGGEKGGNNPHSWMYGEGLPVKGTLSVKTDKWKSKGLDREAGPPCIKHSWVVSPDQKGGLRRRTSSF